MVANRDNNIHERRRERRKSANREAALALSCFLAEYGWPLRVPTGKLKPLEIWSGTDRAIADRLKLPKPGLARLNAFRKSFSIASAFAELTRSDLHMIALGDEDYPQPLAQIHDPPPALFIRGGVDKLTEFIQRTRVAIVGARAASDYGIDAAARIARGLASNGSCIISGMALGIDAAAHRGSVEERGGSIAVLGCGPDVIYPRGNRNLYGSLLEHGLIISEYPPGTKPQAWRFPARNRVMAGLADAVVVVEAKEKSGALITADFSLEEGREVFAVPGSIFSDLSAGPHQLIRSGAAAVTSADDVFESLGIDITTKSPRAFPDYLTLDLTGANPSTLTNAAPSRLTPVEAKIILVLEERPQHQDRLATLAGIDGASAAAALISLELNGLAHMVPGRGYSR